MSGQTRHCGHCGKEVRSPRPSGLCLTCEYKERAASGAETVLDPRTQQLGSDGAGATLHIAARKLEAVAHDETLDIADAGTKAPSRFDDAGSGGGRRTPPPPQPGYGAAEVLGTIDDYDLLSELGKGGMGVVYRAFSRRLGRFVALKLIRSGEYASEIEVARFINEAMLAARLNHPNIVTIHDSGQTEDGRSYFVMELVAGTNLGHYLDVGLAPPAAQTTGGTLRALLRGTGSPTAPPPLVDGRLNAETAILIVEKAARAVHYAHEQGVIHRDIKPDNILIDPRLEPQITDFGIAKGLQQEESAALTTAGSVVGSPQYMSPEQANGEVLAIGPRTDVYSLGATLYHVLTGVPPFTAKSAMGVVAKVLSEEPVRPAVAAKRHGRPAVPIDLETICLKAMEKEASRRYGSALEVADELQRYREGEPIQARPIGPIERLRKKLRKNRSTLIGVFVASTLLITISIAFSLSLFDNIQRSSRSLKSLDRSQAVAQASTLARAIRVNMLQGRADLARELVRRLRKDPDVGSIQVARIDKTPAYSDFKTRRQVEQRLSRKGVLAAIRKKHPEFVDEIAELRRRAFPSIDQTRETSTRPVSVEDKFWKTAVTTRRVVTYVEEARSGRNLVVLRPMKNTEKCQICHGGPDDYEDNATRAVLVVKRSLKPVEEIIESNRRSTLLIGSVTVGVLLLLALLYARVFGIGLRRRRFGDAE